MLGRLGSLAEPQRRGIPRSRSATSLDSPTGSWSPLAALSLMAEGLRGAADVCVVDDAQWLDQASAQVLGFVGHRLLRSR